MPDIVKHCRCVDMRPISRREEARRVKTDGKAAGEQESCGVVAAGGGWVGRARAGRGEGDRGTV